MDTPGTNESFNSPTTLTENTLQRTGWWTRPEREFFIDNLLIRIHLIIEKILVEWPCAMGVQIPIHLTIHDQSDNNSRKPVIN